MTARLLKAAVTAMTVCKTVCKTAAHSHSPSHINTSDCGQLRRKCVSTWVWQKYGFNMSVLLFRVNLWCSNEEKRWPVSQEHGRQIDRFSLNCFVTEFIINPLETPADYPHDQWRNEEFRLNANIIHILFCCRAFHSTESLCAYSTNEVVLVKIKFYICRLKNEFLKLTPESKWK